MSDLHIVTWPCQAAQFLAIFVLFSKDYIFFTCNNDEGWNFKAITPFSSVSHLSFLEQSRVLIFGIFAWI